jgi:phosphonoacetate hydrolase
MMNDPKYLRAATILAAFADAGAKVAVVTAKDKLRALLGHRLEGICFSAEKADRANRDENGVEDVLGLTAMPLPSVYSAALSEFVFAAGVKLVERDAPDIVYLSTTDYVQHKAAPGAAAANDFYAMMDGYLAQLDARGATVVVTADHGMNAKPRSLSPVRVLAEAGIRTHGVPLIRDGLYAHHRDLGGALYLYFDDAGAARDARALLAQPPGNDEVVTREAATRDRLPPERVGDLICWAARDVALGISADGPATRAESGLRSHGSKHEQRIPMLLAGRGVGPGVELREARTVDLMPTLCRLVGVDAGAVQGRVLEDALA